MRVFTTLLTPAEAQARYRAALPLRPLGAETVGLDEALDRILAADLVADEDLPPFDRSTVDGYALRAADVARAALETPVRLSITAEVRMGEDRTLTLPMGCAVRIPTGGVLPTGADAVVMQEHVRQSGGEASISRPLGVGENVLSRGEDVRRGTVVLRAGRRLRSADLGILAGLGRVRVSVRRRPRVAVLSSGDELVPPEHTPAPGQLRDMNAAALAGLVRRAGGDPIAFPILPDDLPTVTEALQGAVARSDLVTISGGSSVGERDVVVDAVAALGPPGVVVHGIAIRPGKPTLLGAAGERPVIALPGNPVSAMVIFDAFVRPLIAALLGEIAPRRPSVRARAGRALAAPAEREDHVRISLEARGDELWAHPLPAKSGLLTSLVHADGIVVVAAGRRVEEGETVPVELLEG
ncbi:MAG TPA: gephyrin-like molybdotransferase Glp [bacterium]|nr:gephyrin-like molybdotransferase Glp [bacterium]